jgi:hypothetical protein
MAALTTGADVAAWLGLAPTEDNAEKYEQPAAVADTHLRSFCTIPTVVPDALKLAATMLAGRLSKRSETPQGMGTLGGDAVFYVARTDPDIESLIAPYRKFGFA